jgi:hypothetical protein
VSTDFHAFPITRRSALANGVAAGGTACLWLLGLGCQRMPAASSAKTVQVLAALRTAISVKSLSRVQEVRQRIDELADLKELSDQELQVMQQIIDLALAEDWKAAEQLCHRFQKAQIR